MKRRYNVPLGLIAMVLISNGAKAKAEFCLPCDQAARVGVNYRQSLAKAQERDIQALSVLFRLADKLDGGAGEVYSGDLERLLESYGDAAFAVSLSNEQKKVRETVVDSLDFAFEVYRNRENWSKKFPRVYRLGSHEAKKRLEPSSKKQTVRSSTPN